MTQYIPVSWESLTPIVCFSLLFNCCEGYDDVHVDRLSARISTSVLSAVTGRNGVSGGMVAVREGGRRGLGAAGAQSGTSCTSERGGRRVDGASRHTRAHQRQRTSLRDVETHAGQVPGHAARLR